jgi:hypothetical protein
VTASPRRAAEGEIDRIVGAVGTAAEAAEVSASALAVAAISALLRKRSAASDRILTADCRMNARRKTHTVVRRFGQFKQIRGACAKDFTNFSCHPAPPVQMIEQAARRPPPPDWG